MSGFINLLDEFQKKVGEEQFKTVSALMGIDEEDILTRFK